MIGPPPSIGGVWPLCPEPSACYWLDICDVLPAVSRRKQRNGAFAYRLDRSRPDVATLDRVAFGRGAHSCIVSSKSVLRKSFSFSRSRAAFLHRRYWRTKSP